MVIFYSYVSLPEGTSSYSRPRHTPTPPCHPALPSNSGAAVAPRSALVPWRAARETREVPTFPTMEQVEETAHTPGDFRIFMDFYGFFGLGKERKFTNNKGTPVMKTHGKMLEHEGVYLCLTDAKIWIKKDRMGNLGCTDFWMNRVECCGTQKKTSQTTSFWGVFLCKTLHGHI